MSGETCVACGRRLTKDGNALNVRTREAICVICATAGVPTPDGWAQHDRMMFPATINDVRRAQRGR